jgi:hypothetical protein
MTIKTVVDSQHGVVQQTDAVGGMTVARNSQNSGFSPYVPPGGTVTGGTAPYGLAFTVDQPGFYLVSGSMQCTGTLPDAQTNPGTMVFVTTNNIQPIMLTGSARPGPGGAFSQSGLGTANLNGGTARGDKLDVDAGGSVALFSDGWYWIPLCASGTVKIHNT